VQNEGVDLATLLQVISSFLVAVFTGLLWFVSKKQAEIADRQTQMQETLARSETEPLVFLEFNRERFPQPSPVALSIVNMGRYGCLVLEVALIPPNWDPIESENEVSEREILAQNVPVLAGERKEAKMIFFANQIISRRSEWWDEFVRKQEFFIEVSYYYGGKPEEIRHDFFRVAFLTRGEIIEIKTVEIAYRSSYHA